MVAGKIDAEWGQGTVREAVQQLQAGQLTAVAAPTVTAKFGMGPGDGRGLGRGDGRNRQR